MLNIYQAICFDIITFQKQIYICYLEFYNDDWNDDNVLIYQQSADKAKLVIIDRNVNQNNTHVFLCNYCLKHFSRQYNLDRHKCKLKINPIKHMNYNIFDRKYIRI